MGAHMQFLATLIVALSGGVKAWKTRHAGKLATKQQGLPEVSAVQAGQENLYEDVANKIGTFKDFLQSSQDQATQALQKKRLSYEKVLVDEVAKNKQLKAENANLQHKIDSNREENLKLHREAYRVIQASNMVSDELKLISSNLTLAEEFADKSLKAAETDFSSPNLHVLVELNQTGKSDVIGHLSVFQLPDAKSDMNSDSTRFLRGLSGSLEALAGQQQASAELMRQKFEKEFSSLEEVHAALLRQQDKLKSTLASEMETQTRLIVALKEVQAVHITLVKRRNALKVFAVDMGPESENAD